MLLQLSTDLGASEVDARWLVTDEISDGSLRPKALGLAVSGFHGNSITLRYQIGCPQFGTNVMIALILLGVLAFIHDASYPVS
jgi:hypothetical protein